MTRAIPSDIRSIIFIEHQVWKILLSEVFDFNQFNAMSVCSPTRISIMTGQNAARHRTTNWINPDKDNAGPNGAPNWNWHGLKKGDVTLASYVESEWLSHPSTWGKGTFWPRDFEGANPQNLVL